MSIIPIFQRELVAAARRERVQSHRASFAGVLLAVVVGTFGTWYYWEAGAVSHRTMARIAEQAFLWTVAFHGVAVMGSVVTRAAQSIAGEKDRRTLDFLLITRLSSAELVVEKLGACLVVFALTIAAGAPVMVLLHLAGGIDRRLILLTYAGLATTAFFLASLATWVSVGAPDGRRAVNVSVLIILAWLVVPFFLPLILSRSGLRLPDWAAVANSWLMASSPLGLAMKLVMGLGATRGLLDAVAWMGGLQAGGGLLFLLGSMIRLRVAHRGDVGGEVRARSRARQRPAWRLRARPAVGDDPILWRERYTARGHALMNALGALLNVAVLGLLAYATWFFARPAVLEVWQHGYTLAAQDYERPEFNLFIPFFVPGGGRNEPDDQARTQFNVFVRFVTLPSAFTLILGLMGATSEVLARERAKETWTSLLATPLVARDILGAAMLAAAWRWRLLIAVILILWTLGAGAGAIHPLGYLMAILALGCFAWFFAALGAVASIRPKEESPANGPLIGWSVMVMISSGVLPLALPTRLSSVLLGTGSPPWVLWQSLVSYRDMAVAGHPPGYLPLKWIGIATAEGPLRVAACCLMAIAGSAIGGWWLWRYADTHFDRLVGRPWRGARSPLAEPNTAV